MTDQAPATRSRTRYWGHSTWGKGAQPVPPGEDLAALRRGLGREPGSVPALWPFYTELTGAGWVSQELRAEHIALSLFGLHQQSQRQVVHRSGPSVGTAARELRHSGRFNELAVDRRLVAAAQSSAVQTLAVHLRGLVQQLSTSGRAEPLDYDRLMHDLVLWQRPDGPARVRRRWGGDYYHQPDRHNPDHQP